MYKFRERLLYATETYISLEKILSILLCFHPSFLQFYLIPGFHSILVS